MAKGAAAPAPAPAPATPTRAASPTAGSEPGPATGIVDPAVTGPLADDAVAQEREAKAARKAAAGQAEVDAKTRKATILANLEKAHQKQKLAVALGDAAPKVDRPLDAPRPKVPDKPIEQVASENAEIRRLKAELAKFGDKKPGQSREEFIEELKKDPGEIFKAIDDPELLVKLAEARQKHLSSQNPEIEALRAEQAAIKAELEQAKSEKQSLEFQAKEAAIMDATKTVILEGKDVTGEQLLDTSGYKITQAMIKSGEDGDVVGRVRRDAGKLVSQLTGGERSATLKEIATIFEIVLDKVEARYRKTVEVARAAGESPKANAPKTETTTRPQDRRPTTLTPRMGGGGTVPVIPSARTKAERKAQVFQRLQTQKLQERMGR